MPLLGSPRWFKGRDIGVPIQSPAMTINRLCGSGFETVIMGAEGIDIGRRSKVVLAGGSENMSAAPMVIDGITSKARWSPPALARAFKLLTLYGLD